MDEVTRAQVPYFLTRDDLSAFAIPRNATVDDTGKSSYSLFLFLSSSLLSFSFFLSLSLPTIRIQSKNYQLWPSYL